MDGGLAGAAATAFAGASAGWLACQMLVLLVPAAREGLAALWLSVLALQGVAVASAVTYLRRHVPGGWRDHLGLADAPLAVRDVIGAALTACWVYPVVMLLTGICAVTQNALGFPVPVAPLLRLAQGQTGPLFWGSIFLAAVVWAPLSEEFLFRHVLDGAGSLGQSLSARFFSPSPTSRPSTSPD